MSVTGSLATGGIGHINYEIESEIIAGLMAKGKILLDIHKYAEGFQLNLISAQEGS